MVLGSRCEMFFMKLCRWKLITSLILFFITFAFEHGFIFLLRIPSFLLIVDFFWSSRGRPEKFVTLLPIFMFNVFLSLLVLALGDLLVSVLDKL